MSARALMYHDVPRGDPEASGFRGPGPARYKVAAGRFAAHLDAIASRCGEPPALATGPDGRERWMLTFDDGGASALDAAGELAHRAWRGHFFIVTSLVGRAGFLGWSDIRALGDMGHVIGAHSHSHPPRISACPWPEQLDEWRRSTEILGEQLGRPATVASVPGGYASRRVAQTAAAAGVRALFTSTPTIRPAVVDGCVVFGRYAVLRDAQAARVAAAAAGRPRAWVAQRASWEARGALKRVAGPHYPRLRRALLSRAST